MTPFEFRRDFWRQKTRVPELSCGLIYIMFTAVVIEYRSVTDRHTTTAYTALSTLRGKYQSNQIKSNKTFKG